MTAHLAFATAVFVAGAFDAAVGGWFWRRNDSTVTRTFAGILGLHTVLGAFVVAQVYAPNRQLSVLAFYAQQFVTNALPLLWFVFAILYVGRSEWVNRRLLAALGVYYVAVISMVATNPLHHLVWTEFELASDVVTYWTGLPGVGWLATIPGLLLYMSGLGLLVEHFFTKSHLGRKQTGLLVAAMLVQFVLPWGHGFGLFGGPIHGTLVLGSVQVGVLAGWAVLRYEMFDVAPVARMTIFDQLNEGILVVDRDYRVLDYNDTAERLFPEMAATHGNRVQAVAPELVDDDGEFVDRGFRYDGRERREFTVSVSTLAPGDTARGHVLIVKDVTERERYLRDLEQHADQLERFASTLSHDIRNPLNVAQGNLRLTLDTGDLDRLETADAALDRIERMIEDLLTLVREGETIEEREVFPLAGLVEDAWRTTDTEAAALELDVDPDVAVYADETRLRNVFENLFRNAVEHGSTSPRSGTREDTVEHGSTSSRPQANDAVEHGSTSNRPGDDDAVEHGDEGVTVTVGTHPDGFFVEDDGPGVPPDERERVFEYEYTTSATGTGLGLAIVETITKAHGWSVSVAEGSDGGARFAFTGVDLVDCAGDDDPTGAADDAPTARTTT